ncbi:MAG: hypothetical protein K8T26_05785 [Lentisphaerae bacterium]|nr:hypothetical protein [Lentisphaerota bacterium]
MFGSAVNDEETLPFRVGMKAEGRYRVHNFGFSGYGPHHMLAQLQDGFVSQALTVPPVVAIYWAIADHSVRVATPREGHFGPRFDKDGDGVVRNGNNLSKLRGLGWLRSTWFWNVALPLYMRSDLLQRLLELQAMPDDELFYRIVDTSRKELEARYPGIEFHVLLWDIAGDGYDAEALRLGSGLEARNIRVHPISRILPWRPGGDANYTIKFDGHPNALAYDIIADYVVSNIVCRQRSP